MESRIRDDDAEKLGLVRIVHAAHEIGGALLEKDRRGRAHARRIGQGVLPQARRKQRPAAQKQRLREQRPLPGGDRHHRLPRLDLQGARAFERGVDVVIQLALIGPFRVDAGGGGTGRVRVHRLHARRGRALGRGGGGLGVGLCRRGFARDLREREFDRGLRGRAARARPARQPKRRTSRRATASPVAGAARRSLVNAASDGRSNSAVRAAAARRDRAADATRRRSRSHGPARSQPRPASLAPDRESCCASRSRRSRPRRLAR